MRIMMLGPSAIATKRNIEWVLDGGHELFFVGDTDPFLSENAYRIRRDSPIHYRFIPFFANRIKIEQGGYDFTEIMKKFTEWVRKWIGVLHLLWLVFRFRPDIIHVQAIYWVSECCALANVHPLVVSAWGFLNYLINSESKVNEQHAFMVNYTLEGSDALIVETPNLIDKCQSLLNPSQQVELIPLGANTKRFCAPNPLKVTQFRQALGIPIQAKVLLSPRSWSPGYGQIDILKAYGIAQKSFKYPTAIAFVGLARGGVNRDLQASFNKLAEEFNITEKIYFLPRLPFEMMPGIYQLADVIVNYPEGDAFPSTLVEAIACERAVISCDLPTYRGTVVEDFCTLVEPKNPIALAEAMVKVINTPTEEFEPILAQARKVIVEEYEEKVAQQKLIQLYQKLIEKRESG